MKENTFNLGYEMWHLVHRTFLSLKADEHILELGYLQPSSYTATLRYDLIDSDHIAFMFNVGTSPDLSIHPIDTNISTSTLKSYKEW